MDWFKELYDDFRRRTGFGSIPEEQTRREVASMFDVLYLSNGSRVLDLFCGPGRHSIELCKRGCGTAGIEYNADYLRLARERAKEINVSPHFIQGDIRNFELDKKFSLITLPINTICHLLELSDLEACLSCVRKHLKPDGRFIFDVFNPRVELLVRDPEKKYPHSEYEDPEDEGKISVLESNRYHAASQINHIKLYYRIPGKCDEVREDLRMRIYFPQELDALLQYNDFKIETKYGDYDENPFASASPKQLTVCCSAPHGPSRGDL